MAGFSFLLFYCPEIGFKMRILTLFLEKYFAYIKKWKTTFEYTDSEQKMNSEIGQKVALLDLRALINYEKHFLKSTFYYTKFQSLL